MGGLEPPFDQLARYHAAGWAVVALHSVTHLSDKVIACSCERGADPDHRKQAGKHPIGLGWQSRGMHSWPDIVATWEDRPGANIGIVTGAPSGIWVLDVDPDADGPARLRVLVEEHAAGIWPATYAVETGSGGWHLYFRMPTDFEPTNSRGRLPPGLDVRGTGGQVVAPPSVSARGPYRVITSDSTGQSLPVADAPEWLLDLIRPREISTDLVGNSRVLHGTVTLAELPQPERERVARYARTAVGAELTRLANAVEGTRNETAFAAACSIHEFLNADWSGLDHREAWNDFAAAVTACGLPYAEGRSVWGKAAARIGLRARDLPRLPDVAWDPPPLLVAPAPNGNGNGAYYGAPQSVEARVVEAQHADPVDAMFARMLDSAGLDLIADLEPLIAGYLSLDTCAWIIGQPATGKSFVALDMALCVATGQPWHSAPTRPGSVLYIAAEGARGVRQRVRAWESRYNDGARVPADRFRILPEPVQVTSPEWGVLTALVERARPNMIVVDTQARVTVGLEENSNSEMGRFVQLIEQLRRASGACVLTVHHETKAGGTARGASAILGAAQTELSVTRDRDLVMVRTSKQKDDEPAVDLVLRMDHESADPVVGPDGLSTPGKGSIVLVEAIAGTGRHPAQLRAMMAADLQHESDKLLLDVAMERFSEPGNGWTRTDFRREYMARGGKSSQFYVAFDRLSLKGIIGRVGGSKERYRFVPVADREPDPLDRMEATDE